MDGHVVAEERQKRHNWCKCNEMIAWYSGKSETESTQSSPQMVKRQKFTL